MKRSTEIDLARRVLAHLAARTTDVDAGPRLVPSRPYGGDRTALETARVFGAVPLPLAHVSELAAPGDFVTRDVAGVPILLVRAEDGTIAAHLNVCRHRGTRVEDAPCGSKKAFACPYHGWVYGRDGRLLAIPHESGFSGIDRDARGLVPVPCATAAGFVWVVPRPARADEPPLDARAWLGPLHDELDGLGTTSASVYGPRVSERPLDWKIAIAIFLEAYHLKTAHARTIYPLFFDNVALVDRFAPHARLVVPKRTIREMATRPEEEWQLRRHANLLFHVFPGTLVLIEPDHAAVVHVAPVAPGRTALRSYMLVPEPPATDKARAHWDANADILYGAVDEDLALGESIQRGIACGANASFALGAFEHALGWFHDEVERTIV